MRLFRPCFLTPCFFPEALFRENTSEKVLYLTFDDGPDVVSTVELLAILARHNIRTLFFCSGKAASEHPGLIEKIRSAGHIVGNHCYDHPDGLFTPEKDYLENVKMAEAATSGNLFRPPYGRMRISQYRKLKGSYHIVMWDLMPYDFDSDFGSERSLNVLKKKIRPGSVIVLHDTAGSCIRKILETFIVYATGKGYRFDIPASAG